MTTDIEDVIDFVEDEEDLHKLHEFLRLPSIDGLLNFLVYKLNKLIKKYLDKASFVWDKYMDYYYLDFRANFEDKDLRAILRLIKDTDIESFVEKVANLYIFLHILSERISKA